MPGSIHHVRKLFAARVASELSAILARKAPSSTAPLLLLNGPPGIGKSTIMARLLAHQRVTWVSPRREMMAELQSAVMAHLPGVEPLPGREQGPPQIQRYKRKLDMCTKPERIEAVRARGLGRYEGMLACQECPSRKGCAYHEWQRTSAWVHAPARWLSLPAVGPSAFGGSKVVVIDESPLSEMLQAVTANETRIAALCEALAKVEGDAPALVALRDLLERCKARLANPPEGVEAIPLGELRGEGAKYGHTSGKMERMARRLQGIGTQATWMDPREARNLLAHPVTGHLKAWQREFLAALVDALAADKGPNPTCVLRLRGGEPGIAAGRVHHPPFSASTPIVVLDAGGSVGAYRKLFRGREVIHIGEQPELMPPQTGTVIQVNDSRSSRYPSSTLTHPDGRALQRLISAMQELAKGKVGVIAPKAVHEQIREAMPEGTLIGSFWGVRGGNEYKDVDTLFVVGAPELPSLDMEAQARAFVSLVPSARAHDSDYVPAERTLSDGRKVREYKKGYPALYWWWVHQAEYAQAIGRARIHDGKDKTVYFFSSVRLPEDTGVELAELETLLGKPSLLTQCEQYVQAQRKAGRTGVIRAAELARELGASRMGVGKAIKNASPERAERIQARMQG